jgi:hypothetical protein
MRAVLHGERFALWVVVAAIVLGGCATTSAECREQVSACLERCQSATPDDGPAKRSRPPESVATECELRCGCRPSSAEPPRPGKATHTGSEPAEETPEESP